MILSGTATLADGEVVTLGGGFIGDPAMKQFMSPERWEAERLAAEKERLDAEQALEAERREAADTAAFWAARHGGAPPKRGPLDVIKEYAAAYDAAERRAAATAHRPDCGCETCGARGIGSGIVAPSRRLPSIVAKENAAADDAFLAEPASIGLVGAMVDQKVAGLKKWLGKR